MKNALKIIVVGLFTFINSVATAQVSSLTQAQALALGANYDEYVQCMNNRSYGGDPQPGMLPNQVCILEAGGRLPIESNAPAAPSVSRSGFMTRERAAGLGISYEGYWMCMKQQEMFGGDPQPYLSMSETCILENKQ